MSSAQDTGEAAPGTRLGPYVLGERLGAGGMGVVYRARDERLRRDVAIKLLPAEFRSPERLRRFLTEARAAAALSHPNVLAVFDVSTDGDRPYIVTELLEGQSLAQLLADGPPPTSRALTLATQAARGLAAAHERGIVHRDLKPSNLFVTRDGTLKVLDFGLAKVDDPEAPEHDETSTATSGGEAGGPITREGAVLGTLGYMAPEQVLGKTADARSDLFAFGCVLYELLSGKRAFDGPTPLDVSHAIARDEPAPLPAQVPAALARLCARCMQKDPAERFQSARDLVFALEVVGGESGAGAPAAASGGTRAKEAKPGRRGVRLVLVAGASAAALAAAFAAGSALRPRGAEGPAPAAASLGADGSPEPASAEASPVRYTQITWRPGLVNNAHFAPDGASVIFSAVQDGVARVYSAVPGNMEVRPLSGDHVSLLDVSSRGDLALTLGDSVGLFDQSRAAHAVLARAALAGGAARPVLEDVTSAVWSPDGAEMLVIHRVEGRKRVEYPIGHVLLDTDAWQVAARPSPNGSGAVALVELRIPSHGAGRIELLEPGGARRPLTGVYRSLNGFRWAPGGREIWFTTDNDGPSGATLRAVTLDGRERAILQSPASISLRDIAPDGRALLTVNIQHHRVAGLLPGRSHEADLSWFEWSDRPELSPDGRALLTTVVQSPAQDFDDLTFFREEDAGAAVQVGHGQGLALSADAGLALLATGPTLQDLSLVPTGAGAPQAVAHGTLDLVTRAFFFPDGKRLLVVGRERDRPLRLWMIDGTGSPPAPLSDEGIIASCGPSPDGAWIPAFRLADRSAVRVTVAGGPPKPIEKLAAGLVPIGWTEGGRGLFVRHLEQVERLDGYVTSTPPVRIERFDLARGALTPWRDIVPGEPAGSSHVDLVSITPDGRSYAYAYAAWASTLYAVSGLR